MSLNTKINLISSKTLIGEFLLDFDIQLTNYLSSLNRHIVRGIEMMEIDTFYRRCVEVCDTEEGRVFLPCTSKYIEVIILNGTSCPHFLDLTNNGLRLLNGVQSSKLYGYVEGQYLNLNTYEGKVVVLYKSLPKDKEGYVMIPDDPWVKDALLYFLIFKMGLSGFKHKVISRQEAEEKWRNLYPRARNSVNFPSVHDIERYTSWNTEMLFNNIDRIETYESLSNVLPSIYSEGVTDFASFVNKLKETLGDSSGHIEFSNLDSLP